MASQLQTLLDLRRKAERDAQAAMEMAVAARVREDAAQARLVTRWQAAKKALDKEQARWTAAPETAAQALMRENHLRRLADGMARVARLAEEHRQGPLGEAAKHERAARLAYEEARAALDTACKLKARADAEAAKLAERRAEETAADHANAAFVRRKDDV
ncbi:MAG: hypothetical protein JXP73_11110 [Deltaproteobacteria bacterium]|jgi:flagellar biosynthesis chaperone FliJ|nr:hypothetical protein [Deltaproteobacteria bacterium]